MDFSALKRKKKEWEDAMELELPCPSPPLGPGRAYFRRSLTSIDSQDSVRESGAARKSKASPNLNSMDKPTYFSLAESFTKSDPKISLALSPFLSGNKSTPAVDSGNPNSLIALHQRIGFSLLQFLKDHEVPGSDQSTPTYNFPLLDPYLKEEEQEDFRSPTEFLTDHEADDEASAAEVHSNLKKRRAGKQRISRHNLRYQHLRGRNAPQHVGSDMEHEVNDKFELPFILKSANSQPVTARDTQPSTSKLVPHSGSCPSRVIVISTSSEENDSDSNSDSNGYSDMESEYETEAMVGSQDEMSLDTESSSSDSVSEASNKENRQPYFGTPDISDLSPSSTNSPTEYVVSNLARERSSKSTTMRHRYGSLAEVKSHCDSRKFPAQGLRARTPRNSAPASSLARDPDNSGPRGKKVTDWPQFASPAPPHSYESPSFVPSKTMMTYIKEISMVEVAPGFLPEPTCGQVAKGRLEADAEPVRLKEELTHRGNREKKNVHGEHYESLAIGSKRHSTVLLSPHNEVGTRNLILRGEFSDEEMKVMLDKSALAKSGRNIIPLERMRVKKAKNSDEVENSRIPEKIGEESDNSNPFAELWSEGAGANVQIAKAKKDDTTVDESKEASGNEENSKAESKP